MDNRLLKSITDAVDQEIERRVAERLSPKSRPACATFLQFLEFWLKTVYYGERRMMPSLGMDMSCESIRFHDKGFLVCPFCGEEHEGANRHERQPGQ